VRNPKILVLDKGNRLADQVRGVASELRPRPEVVPCDKPTTAGDLLSDEGPFDVLVAGPDLGTRAGLSRIQLIHDELPSMSIVLAFSERPEAQLRDVVRAGAIDLLHLPVADRALRETIERAVGLSRPNSNGNGAAPGTGIGTAGAAAPKALGTVFTVASATGGCGKTFYATNMAYFLARHTGKTTCIVDLDLQFGEVSTALRLRPKFTISDALQREDEELNLNDHLEEYVVAHESGINVLAAPKDPSEADRIHPSDVSKVIEAARAHYDYVIVDTPAALTEIVLAAFDLSNELFVLATLDLPSVRNMGVFLNTLEKLKIPADNVKLVLNKAERDVGIDLDQVNRLFPQGFVSVLPYAREVSKSVNMGTPILGFNPTSEVSRLMASGMNALLPEDERVRAQANAAKAPGLFTRMFNRSHNH